MAALRPDYSETSAEVLLERDENGVPLPISARSNSKMQWRRNGTNAPPMEAMTASLQNLRMIINSNDYQVLEELLAQGGHRHMLHSIAPVTVLWHVRTDPRNRDGAILPIWHAEMITIILNRVFFGDHHEENSWQATTRPICNPRDKSAAPRVSIGNITRAGENQNCPACGAGKTVYLLVGTVDDVMIVHYSTNCSKGHKVSANDVNVTADVPRVCATLHRISPANVGMDLLGVLREILIEPLVKLLGMTTAYDEVVCAENSISAPQKRVRAAHMDGLSSGIPQPHSQAKSRTLH